MKQDRAAQLTVEMMARVHWWSLNQHKYDEQRQLVATGVVSEVIERAWIEAKELEMQAMTAALENVTLRHLIAA